MTLVQKVLTEISGECLIFYLPNRHRKKNHVSCPSKLVSRHLYSQRKGIKEKVARDTHIVLNFSLEIILPTKNISNNSNAWSKADKQILNRYPFLWIILSHTFHLVTSTRLCPNEVLGNVHKCYKCCYEFLYTFSHNMIEYTERIGTEIAVPKISLLPL